MQTAIGRVFMNGNRQAVRIPREFRLASSRVQISLNADGDLVLHPIPADRGAALLDVLKAFDDEFAALVEAGHAEPAAMHNASMRWGTTSSFACHSHLCRVAQRRRREHPPGRGDSPAR